MKEGVVIKSTGSWYIVKDSISQEAISCRIKGKFRLDGLKLTNPLAVGDIVEYDMEEDGKGMVSGIKPRRNYIVRQSPRKKHNLHLIASNVDQAVLIVTIVEPMLKQGFIDRFLLMTEPYDVPVHIVFNKADLYQEEHMDIYAYLEAVYQNIGYQTHLVSAVSGKGLDTLQEALTNKISLISGQSGVGKSTLVNAIQPQLELATTDISDYTGKGQHTTTFAEMFDLEFGGSIIDSPGIKTLSFNHLDVKDVAHNFREFFLVSKECKFTDCAHRNEPKCAVKDAVENGEISELRYKNYLLIVDEVENQNYWELNTEY